MVRILDTETVGSLLTPQRVLDAIRELFTLLADREAAGYGRLNLSHPKGWLRYLPGYIVPKGVLGFKVLHRTSGVGMRYTIYVHDLESGELTGIVDGLEITNLRTGAVSAVGTDHLAVEAVRVAALVGTGPVAGGQLQELQLVRPAEEIRVFARTPENRRRFIEEMSGLVDSRLVEASSLEEAVEGAGLVTLATKAVAPLLFARHLVPGMHVNSVPSIFDTFDRVVCDSVELVIDEAGDAYRAVADGQFESSRAEDLARVVSGERPGRSSPADVTLFKSVGTGLQDLIVAVHLLEAAAGEGRGTVVDEFVSVKPVGAPG
jgi:ornithine cyclodeaminase/alanine dehydrogenase-like protein (mu-crystallin family)